MTDTKTTRRCQRVSDRDLGFRLGIAVAAGFLVHGHNETSLARELLETADMTAAKARTADATDYDLSAIRRAFAYG